MILNTITNKSDVSSSNEQFYLTAREFTALIITFLIAVHLVARELGIILIKNAFQKEIPMISRKPSLSRSSSITIDNVLSGKVSLRQLESKQKTVGDKVKLRIEYLKRKVPDYKSSNLFEPSLDPEIDNFYQCVDGKCCENTVGFVNIPLGYVGPLVVNHKEYFVPMATTEGALIASTSRGCKLLTMSGGVRVELISDKMTRGPIFETDSLSTSCVLKSFIESRHDDIKDAFEATSRFARLLSIKVSIGPSCYVFVRFSASTGDAMGMNMVSKASEQAILFILKEIQLELNNGCYVKLASLSGNFCVDKKASSSNWINGRGKSVVAEAILSNDHVRKILRLSNTNDLIRINSVKNFLGSAMSASQPGASCNAQAANVVAAIFCACGQDLGQVGTSSACMTWIEEADDDHLRISVTMPCIEVGTVGGGTHLPIQSSCLQQLGVLGSSKNKPGENAFTLASIIASTVMAAELSLLAALCTNDLVKAHMNLNRAN